MSTSPIWVVRSAKSRSVLAGNLNVLSNCPQLEGANAQLTIIGPTLLVIDQIGNGTGEHGYVAQVSVHP